MLFFVTVVVVFFCFVFFLFFFSFVVLLLYFSIKVRLALNSLSNIYNKAQNHLQSSLTILA